MSICEAFSSINLHNLSTTEFILSNKSLDLKFLSLVSDSIAFNISSAATTEVVEPSPTFITTCADTDFNNFSIAVSTGFSQFNLFNSCHPSLVI